jgi:glyoxylase-like metal-dependent hydrolase (beta-lactamase superfamily II)
MLLVSVACQESPEDEVNTSELPKIPPPNPRTPTNNRENNTSREETTPSMENATSMEVAVPACEGRTFDRFPEGFTFIDPADGSETSECTRIVRVTSYLATPELRERVTQPPSYSYLILADDGRVVLVNGGYTHQIVALEEGRPVFEENTELRSKMNSVVGYLAKGKGLADIAAIYIDHAHPDHTMQASWVARAQERSVPVWIGEADKRLATVRGAVLEECSTLEGFPQALADLLPSFVAPEFELKTIPADTPGESFDGGHGVQLIAAPSHTPGTILVGVPSLGVVVANNHLCRQENPADNDCRNERESSVCHVPCEQYDETIANLPQRPVYLRVHPEQFSRCEEAQ